MAFFQERPIYALEDDPLTGLGVQWSFYITKVIAWFEWRPGREPVNIKWRPDYTEVLVENLAVRVRFCSRAQDRLSFAERRTSRLVHRHLLNYAARSPSLFRKAIHGRMGLLVMSVEVQDHLKMTDGFDLFYRHWKASGEGRGVVLCVHGGGRNSEYFESLGEALSREGIDVYAPDLRGLGNSVEKGLSKGDVRSFKRHLQDLVDAVSYVHGEHPGKKVFLLGHSYGGNYAIWYAANHSETLDGMVLMAPGVVTTMKVPLSLMIRGPFYLLFAPKTPLPSDNMWPESVRNSEDVKFFNENPLDTPAMSARFVMRGLAPVLNKTLENATRVTVPTLVMQGEADPLVLLVGARKLLDRLAAKDKTLKTFTDADHFFYHTIFPKQSSQDDPAKIRQVIATVSDWIRAH
jgi:alpha-beta hydrolase superfamily lysophospholipase